MVDHTEGTDVKDGKYDDVLGMMPSSDNDDRFEAALEDQQQEAIDGLSKHVRQCFERAKQFKENRGIETLLNECLRQYKGEYTGQEKADFDGIDVYRNITAMLCMTAESMVRSAYSFVEDKPWALRPTPRPNLPFTLEEALKEAEKLQVQELGPAIADLPPEAQTQLARSLTEAAHRLAFEDSVQSLKGMDRKISDQMDEGDWVHAFTDFRSDVFVYPTAILKGPVVHTRRVADWNDKKEELEFELAEIPVVESVSPHDAFPSPDSTDGQDGEFFIERMRLQRSVLIKCKKGESFDARAIDLCLDEGGLVVGHGSAHGHSAGETTDCPTEGGENIERDHLEVFDSDDPNLVTVYDFWGRVMGSQILSFMQKDSEMEESAHDGTTVDTHWGEIDPLESYEINAWLCGDYVIRALINPMPLDKRPYYASSYVKVSGSFWGMGIPQLVCDVQREMNGAARSRVFNVGIASGPLVEVDASRMPEGNRPDRLTPWSIWYTENTLGPNNGQRAINFNQANSNAGELTAIMEECWAKAHDLVGLPPHTRGVNQGSARTLGAFALQYNNTNKGVQRLMSNIDHDVIVPLIEAFYYFNMVYCDDNSIKSDAQIKALGALGLLRKEQREARPLETLQAIGALLEDKPQARDALLVEFLTERGYDPAQLGLAPSLLQQGAGVSDPSLNPNEAVGPAPPQLDGRSGAAQQVLNGAVVPPQGGNF